MADFATDFFSHRWDFFKDPIHRLFCSADDDDDDDGNASDDDDSGGVTADDDDDDQAATERANARDDAKELA